MEVHYLGEHLWAGRLGQIAVYSSLIFSLAAAIAFFRREYGRSEQAGWLQAARIAYLVHFIAVIAIAAILFVIIQNHWFEYYYAWAHSSRELPKEYLLSCFWEGQEGSFLLWMFWNAVLGLVVLWRRPPAFCGVLGVVALVQFFLSSMLLGIYVFGYKIGSTPFALLRHEMQDAPIFQRADYLSFIADGNGLNPLLQNYWMVIHPPVLFLGFAASLLPFAWAAHGLVSRNFTAWAKPVLPWALFAAAALGTGIMMGGAWAYESLTFGGYWAWDPVENASLVPWLLLIAGIHTNVVFNHTGRSLRATFLFYLMGFALVLYSTFLTRSGILGDTSVHAFTDLGMSGQLLIYMASISLPALALLAWHWRRIPTVQQEEEAYSREFWIFVGTLILLLSSIQITFSTSIPVWNKIFGTNWAPPAEPIEHYNKWQLPIAIVILLLSASGLLLRYRKSDVRKFWRQMAWFSGISAVLAGLLEWYFRFANAAAILLLFASLFGVVVCGFLILDHFRRRRTISGGSVAHFGFALLLLGVLISSAKKEVISVNRGPMSLGSSFSEEQNRTNVLLIKGMPVTMHRYVVTYLGDSVAPPNYYYKVLWERYDTASGAVREQFVLLPNAQINPRMGLIANPDTRHYWYKDLYTHVTSVPDKTKQAQRKEPVFTEHTVAIGDTIRLSRATLTVEGIGSAEKREGQQWEEGDLPVEARITIKMDDGRWHSARPVQLIRDLRIFYLDEHLPELGLTIRLARVLPDERKLIIGVEEREPEHDFIVLTAILFPYINLVWLGTIFTILGFVLALLQRRRQYAVAS
ncbi:MAG: cytochrome c biogenesis protein CcsA [Chitinophagales bacterium]|nr:cytochrome c biogenesis protein CcsA [Chitinophagales bacterium]MDW8392736.1 cytochrome c biogenesis protein CcsA [Chitinophagales bacterium]